MSKAQRMDKFLGFRFTAEFFCDSRSLKKPWEYGFTSLGTSSRGFEAWRAIRTNETTIFQVIGEANEVEVVLYPRNDDDLSRVFRFGVWDPVHLPMAMDPLIGGHRVSNEKGLDATTNAIALEGVMFKGWRMISVKDEVRKRE